MSYIKFFPSILKDDDIVDENVLWKAGYVIYDLNNVDPDILSFLQKRIDLAYPLSFWEENIETWPELVMHKNFPFKKSYIIKAGRKEIFCLTLTALDIRAENNSFNYSFTLAAKYLFLIGYSPSGSAHPERFYNRLSFLKETSMKDFEKDYYLRSFIKNAEDLCADCIKYESFLTWQSYEDL